MSCPHPRDPVERVVGNFSELVCPDCHARLAPAAFEPDYSLEDLDDEAHCNFVADDFYCVLPADHIGPHGGYEDPDAEDEPAG